MSSAIRQGRTNFFVLAALFILFLLVFLLGVATVGNGDILGALGVVALLLALLILTYKGYRWAHWLLGGIQLLLGIILLLFGFDEARLELKLLGLLLWSCGAPLLMARSVREFLKAQRQKEAGLSKGLFSQDADSLNPDSSAAGGFPIDPTQFPSLRQRVQATFVDSLIPLFVAMMLVGLVPGIAEWPPMGKLLLVAVCYLYEPILSSVSLTVGQHLTGTRIRRYQAHDQRLSFGAAYGRFLTKVFLGWFSYLFIHFNPERRALHDLVAGTVVLRAPAVPAIG